MIINTVKMVPATEVTERWVVDFSPWNGVTMQRHVVESFIERGVQQLVENPSMQSTYALSGDTLVHITRNCLDEERGFTARIATMREIAHVEIDESVETTLEPIDCKDDLL